MATRDSRQPEPAGSARSPSTGSPRLVGLIGAFKLGKGLLLALVGIAALHFLHRDVAGVILPLIGHLHLDPDSRYLARPVSVVLALNDHALTRLSLGMFVYAALLLTEGVGLLLERRWAEYFTVIVTASFIPLEVYELARRLTVTRFTLLGVNVAVVWYLVQVLRRQRATQRPHATV